MKLLQYLSSSSVDRRISAHNSRPFYLLLPVYIASKQYWQSFVSGQLQTRDQKQQQSLQRALWKVQYVLPPDSYCVSVWPSCYIGGNDLWIFVHILSMYLYTPVCGVCLFLYMLHSTPTQRAQGRTPRHSFRPGSWESFLPYPSTPASPTIPPRPLSALWV